MDTLAYLNPKVSPTKKYFSSILLFYKPKIPIINRNQNKKRTYIQNKYQKLNKALKSEDPNYFKKGYN